MIQDSNEEKKNSLQKIVDAMVEMNKNRKPQPYDWGYITPENMKKLDAAFKEVFDKQNKTIHHETKNDY